MNINGMPNKPMNIGGIQNKPNNVSGITKFKPAANPFQKVRIEKEFSRKTMNAQGENLIRRDMMSTGPSGMGGNNGN